MVKRQGARAGDRIAVTGTIGDAALGLDILRGGRAARRISAERDKAEFLITATGCRNQGSRWRWRCVALRVRPWTSPTGSRAISPSFARCQACRPSSSLQRCRNRPRRAASFRRGHDNRSSDCRRRRLRGAVRGARRAMEIVRRRRRGGRRGRHRDRNDHRRQGPPHLSGRCRECREPVADLVQPLLGTAGWFHGKNCRKAAVSLKFRCKNRPLGASAALLRRADFGMVRADLGRRLMLFGAASIGALPLFSGSTRGRDENQDRLFHDSFVGDRALPEHFRLFTPYGRHSR